MDGNLNIKLNFFIISTLGTQSDGNCTHFFAARSLASLNCDGVDGKFSFGNFHSHFSFKESEFSIDFPLSESFVSTDYSLCAVMSSESGGRLMSGKFIIHVYTKKNKVKRTK
jgi:hypothetical protein